MRVGIVCPYSLTLAGGVQAQVLDLACALQRRGIQARVLAPCDGPPPHPSVTPLGNSIPVADNGSVAPIAPDPAAALRTIRALRDEQFDVVHLHEPLTPGPSLTALISASTPLVGTFHRSGPNSWVRALPGLARWCVDHLAVRAAVSQDALQTATEAFGGRYELLWNGVDAARYQGGEEVPKSREPTVLFIGRHEPRKGLSVLLDALDLLGDDVRLWVASSGPETAKLKRRRSDDHRIEWLGHISETEKVRRLRAAHVFCAPSLHGESFGVVLLEALAASTAVVASDIPGYRRVVRHEVEGRLVEPGDPGGLAKAIQEAVGDGPRGGLIDRGLERAHHFSMERLADRYVQLYESAAGRPA